MSGVVQAPGLYPGNKVPIFHGVLRLAAAALSLASRSDLKFLIYVFRWNTHLKLLLMELSPLDQ